MHVHLQISGFITDTYYFMEKEKKKNKIKIKIKNKKDDK